MSRYWTDNLAIGATVAALAAVGNAWLIPAFTTASATGAYDLSPTLVPHISLGLCLVLGLLLCLQSLGARRDGRPAPPGVARTGDGATHSSPGVWLFRDLLMWGASSMVTVVLLPRLGFIATATALLAVWLVFAGARRWPVVIGVAVILPVLLDRLSWYALTVRLP